MGNVEPLHKYCSDLEVGDISALQDVGIRLWPVKIERINDKKVFAFPRNGQPVKEWAWIKDTPQPTAAQLHDALSKYDLAGIIPANIAVIDCDDATAYQYVFEWLSAMDCEPICERSLSWTPENQKHHFYFITETPMPYCTKFAALGFRGRGELLGEGHLVFLNKSGWYFPPSENTFLELPEIPTTKVKTALSQESLVIQEGERNHRLTSIAGGLRRHGVSADNIFQCLLIVNRQCSVLLDNKELESIAHSISRYDPKQPISELYADIKNQLKGAI